MQKLQKTRKIRFIFDVLDCKIILRSTGGSEYAGESQHSIFGE